MVLEDVADIIIGVLVNRVRVNDGKYKHVLFKLDNNSNEEEIRTNNVLNNKLTKKGDIIFRLVYPNKMVLVNDEAQENILIPSYFCIIRVKQNMMNPVFLKWYLENGEGKNQLALLASGTTILKITVDSLKKIKVPKIDMEIQKKLKDIIELWNKEKIILKKITDKKDDLYNGIIEEILTEKEQ